MNLVIKNFRWVGYRVSTRTLYIYTIRKISQYLLPAIKDKYNTPLIRRVFLGTTHYDLPEKLPEKCVTLIAHCYSPSRRPSALFSIAVASRESR
jgi:hypothetical protein